MSGDLIQSEGRFCQMYNPDVVRVVQAVAADTAELKSLIENFVVYQQAMAQAIERMASSMAEAEKRAEKADERYEHLAETAMGKNQIPLRSHFWTLGAALMPTVLMSLGVVLGVLWVTKQDIRASLTEIEVTQQRILQEANKK